MSTPALQRALGAAIQSRRKALHVSQEDFAEQLGMHRTQLGAIEQGRKDCRFSTLVRISEGLGVDLWLLIKDVESS